MNETTTTSLTSTPNSQSGFSTNSVSFNLSDASTTTDLETNSTTLLDFLNSTLNASSVLYEELLNSTNIAESTAQSLTLLPVVSKFTPSETSDFDNFTQTDGYSSSYSLNNSSVPFLNFTTNETTNDVPFYMNFRNEPWVIPLVALSLFNVAAILVFEIYVIYKFCTGRRNLFLGQVLLYGLLLCSLLALTYVIQPHWVLCGITRAGLGLAYTLVFGTLLVKCTFLLKLHSGVFFNASFQAFFLFFIVAVEVVIVTQWLVYDPPATIQVNSSDSIITVCSKNPIQRTEYLVYVMLLIFMVIVASIRSRSLRENNREALYIGISIAISLVLWVAWIAVALIFDRTLEAPAEAFGLSCTSLVIFLLIFMPKAVQLASKDSHMTTGSTIGSHSVIHTPSFLHLQPHAVLPGSAHGTLIKQTHLNTDYCRNYNAPRLWRYDYPGLQEMEASALSSDMNSLKKSNNGSFTNHTPY